MNRMIAASALGLTAAAVCGESFAQTSSKFDITIGGDAYFEAAYVQQDRDSGLRSTEARDRFRLVITPLAKADNGLEYGARIRMRANTGARTVDADLAYLFAQGGFGTIKAGVVNPYSDDVLSSMQGPRDYRILFMSDPLVAYIDPTSNSAAAGGQIVTGTTVQGPDIGSIYSGQSSLSYRHSVLAGLAATRISYNSPRFAGFQAGVTYAPRNDSANTDVNRVKTSTLGPTAIQGTFSDIIEAAVNYNEKFGDLTVKAFGEIQSGKAIESTANAAGFKDMRVWHVGGQLAYSAFSIGGGYLDFGQTGESKAAVARRDDNNLWHVTGQYRSGPVAVGLGYQRGQDAGSLLVAGRRRLEIYDVGLLYTVVPGLVVGGEYDYFKARSDQTTAALNRDDKGSAVILRTALSF